MRRLVAALLLSLTCVTIRPLAAAGPEPLDARLGGSRTTFEVKYDEPSTEESAASEADGRDPVVVRYEIADFQDVTVSLSAETVVGITFSPARDDEVASEDAPATPDETTWDTRKAARFAKRFLPRDATCAREPIEATAVVRTVSCRSDALVPAVAPDTLGRLAVRGDAGDVFYRLHLNDTGRVHTVDVALGDGTRVFEGDGTIPEAAGSFAPTRILIPVIGIDAAVESTPIVDRVMGIPSDPWNVGWYPSLATPGDGGNVVMAGHVDWWNIGPVVFANLASIWPGATVYLIGADGTGASYVVTSVYAVPYNTRAAEVTGSLGVEGLTLITCTGTFDGTHYDSRLVVRTERF